ncbi:MAG: hypothetical protein ACRD18_15425 [Terriglobia bacterium]
MGSGQTLSSAAILDYLHSRRRWIRWREWASGRRYLLTRYGDRSSPVVVIAHSHRDARAARQISLSVEQDWLDAPQHCREAYDEILFRAPGLIVIQLRQKNLCGCLGHRHAYIKEPPFAESHDAFGSVAIGEMDVAYKSVEPWPALPLSDTAMDTKFLEGSRLEEFHKKQFRLKILSIILHETHHLVAPQEPEQRIRERSLAFYHDSLASYVESAVATLSLTIDRSFFRLE